VWATVGKQADQARSRAGSEDLDIGVEHGRVAAGDDHCAVRVAGLDGLEGVSPFGRVERAAEVIRDRQVESLAVLVDALKEARQPSLLDH